MKIGYALSPEFHRNLWMMKLTPLAAAVVAALFVLLGVATSHMWSSNGVDLRVQTLFFMYFFVVIIGGCYTAAFSMREEMKDNTWDFLRISAISPAQLAFGKLFGATAYAWYWGILITFLYYLTFSADESVHIVAYFMIMAALMGHATAYLISMSSVPASTQHMISRDVGMGTPAFLTGCGVAMAISTTFLEAFLYHYGWIGGEKRRFFSELVWYGQSIEIFVFWAVSIAFGLFWLLLGSYRLVRTELMHRVTPSAWMVFLASLIVWTGGFAFNMEEPSNLKNYLLVENEYVSHRVLFASPHVLAAKWAFFISAAICYLTMLSESSDVRRYVRLGGAIRRRDFRRILDDLPRWAAVLPFVAVSFGALLALLWASPPGEDADVCLIYFMLSVLLFIARDGFVLHLLHKVLKRRAAIAILFYFICVSVALPALLLYLEHGLSAFKRLVALVADMCTVASTPYYLFPEDATFALFFPTGTTDFYVSVLPAALQALLAGLIFFWLRNKRDTHIQGVQKK